MIVSLYLSTQIHNALTMSFEFVSTNYINNRQFAPEPMDIKWNQALISPNLITCRTISGHAGSSFACLFYMVYTCLPAKQSVDRNFINFDVYTGSSINDERKKKETTLLASEHDWRNTILVFIIPFYPPNQYLQFSCGNWKVPSSPALHFDCRPV